MNNKYDGQVEVTVGVLVFNSEGKILLAKSPKWGNKYVMPGGHVDFNETLSETAIREAKEETNLDVKPLHILYMGTILNNPDFLRQAHFVFIDIACQLIGSEIKADEREISQLKWFTPEEAVNLPLVSGVKESIQNHIAGVHTEIGEFVFNR